MPLPTPKLDDRRFQDIVDEAKRLIPQYCPEWTDHNVSDPGVTLIELFAWMTDLLLYRVNQVPDKMYVKFLEMIGVRLAPPQAAEVPLTFYLAPTKEWPLVITAGTEVCTSRTESVPAIVFTTEADLELREARLVGVYSQGATDGSPWRSMNLTLQDRNLLDFELFSPIPSPDDAFYLLFDADLGRHVVALHLTCGAAQWAEIDPHNPPWLWEVLGEDGLRWVGCGPPELDSTLGFNQAEGVIILHLPVMGRTQRGPHTGYWLRCRLLPDAWAGRTSPRLKSISVKTIGGTTMARHATWVTNEQLGVSNGADGQVLQFAHWPVLTENADRPMRLCTITPDGQSEDWTEVENLASAGPDAAVFELDRAMGRVTFGPAIRQPNGTVYRFGKIPRAGSRIVAPHYKYGGGCSGNVTEGALCIMRQARAPVHRVTNLRGATGGLDAQTLDDAKVRAPAIWCAQRRAVTAQDYEAQAMAVEGVARARCIAAELGGGAGGQPPGGVTVVVLPNPDAFRTPTLNDELRIDVESRLDEVRPIGVRMRVRGVELAPLEFEVHVQVTSSRDAARLAEAVEAALRGHLDPWTGGRDREGWPLGGSVHATALTSLIHAIPGVVAIDELVLRTPTTTPAAGRAAALTRLELKPFQLPQLQRVQVKVREESR